MKRFKIYAGLTGGFNNVVFQGVEEHKTEEDATVSAYEHAKEEYESYEGLHGLRDLGQIMDEDSVDEDEAQGIYEEERESWIEYYAVELAEGVEVDEDGEEIVIDN